MEKYFMPYGAESITAMIRDAISSGAREVVITGNWEITGPVRIPSNFTLNLINCHLRLADGVYSNIFVNEHHDTPEGNTPEGRDRNIRIIGLGEVILDGGNYNGLSEKTQKKDGLPPIWKNNLILFTNVDGFCISNIQCHNQRWWAMNFIYCAHGLIENIHFKACDIGIDQNGNPYHGLKRECYSEVLVKNADGIDLRQGCHDIEIRKITGFCEDDSVALTCLNGSMEQRFAVKGLSPELCRVTVENVKTAAYCSNVRLLNQGGMILRDILVDGMNAIGWKIEKSKATMFVWAALPEGYTDSRAFAMELLEKAGVLVTPGAAFGPSGEGHIRCSYATSLENLTEALKRIESFVASLNQG